MKGFLKDSLKIDAPEFSSVQAQFSTDKESIIKAIELNHNQSKFEYKTKIKLQKQLIKKIEE